MAQLMKFRSLKSLGYKLSRAVKIFPENFFYRLLNFKKIYFFIKIIFQLRQGYEFSAQVKKNTPIESLGSILSTKVKIIIATPGKLFYITLNVGKKYFFLQNLNFNCQRGAKFLHKSKTIY